MQTNAALRSGWVDTLSESAAAGVWEGMIMGSLSFGPRWNTHTNVHSWDLGFRQPCKLSLEIENVRLPGFSWQVVCYGNMDTLASQGVAPNGVQWLTVPLNKGKGDKRTLRITLMIRLYMFDGCEEARLPRIKLNGKLLKNYGEVDFTISKLQFNRELRAKQKFHHLAMQWHVMPMLRARKLLPVAMVRDVYLPVGNPETQWLYGIIFEKYALRVNVVPFLLHDHLVFVTVYSRASIPTQPSITITKVVSTLHVSLEDGFWAMRIVRKDGACSAPEVKDLVSIAMVRSDSAVAIQM